MKDNEVIESNKLIAEFMGCEHKNVYNIDHYFVGGSGLVQVGSLGYHTSWDWLMPVVEKIEGMLFTSDCGENDTFDYKYLVRNEGVRCLLHANVSSIYHQIEGKGKNKIATCYDAIVKFITWYNSDYNQLTAL